MKVGSQIRANSGEGRVPAKVSGDNWGLRQGLTQVKMRSQVRSNFGKDRTSGMSN